MPDNLKAKIRRLQQAKENYDAAKEELRVTSVEIVRQSGLDFLLPKDVESMAKQAEWTLKDQVYEEIRKNTIDFYKKDS